MRRTSFVAGSLGLAFVPALAIGKETMLDPAGLLAELKAKESESASLTVRHLGAFVTTQTTVTVEQLARSKPLHDTRDKAEIAAAFAAIEAAEPAPARETSEQRWHLTFADASNATILVVTSAVFAPRHGTIAGNDVIFRTNRLVHWLAERYAPEEASALR